MPVRITMEIGESLAQIRAAVLGLAAVSLAQMREKPLPQLYSSGIRYVREPGVREAWQSAAETYAKLSGDCEDLAAYRVAELHKAGERAATIGVRRITPTLLHIVVRRANGYMEDPSKKLGMSGKG